MSSKKLNKNQMRAIDKIGNAMIPGFSNTQCVLQVDRILDYMPEQDLKDLKMLLGIFGILPQFMVTMKIHFLEWIYRMPIPLGGLIRTIRLGLRGLVMTLYYSDPKVLKEIEYNVSVYTADLNG